MTPKVPRGRRTGTLETRTYAGGRVAYVGRLRLADGTKSGRMPAPDGMSKADAARWLAGQQAREDAERIVYTAKLDAAREVAASKQEPHVGETAGAWYRRFLASSGRAMYDDENASSANRWEKWIAPHLAHLPIAKVGREDVERVRDGLDVAVRTNVIRPKTAQNVWAVLTTAFKAARNAKDRTLRVREDNPCADVLPPDDGPSRAKHWLFPREAEALFACAAVPLEWRRTFAVAIFTGLRPEESAELRWKDVDFAAGELHVTRAFGWRSKVVELPKSQAGIRRVPLEPELVPLLKAMGHGKSPDDLVVPFVRTGGGKDKLAPKFRRSLEATGACRPAIFETTETHVAIGFRACRDTYATWSAIAGRAIATVATRLGHEGLETTRGYYREVEDRPGLQGAPFPSLVALYGEAVEDRSQVRGTRSQIAPLGPPSGPSGAQVPGIIVEAPGIEPPQAAGIVGYSEVSEGDTTRTPSEDSPKPPPAAHVPAHVEDALAEALRGAAAAGRWDVVAQLARELEARRLASAGNVTPIGKRGGK